MYDINSPYDDEEEQRRRAIEALGMAGRDQQLQQPDEATAIQALARENQQPMAAPSAPGGSGAAPNPPVDAGDDSGPGLNGWAVAADLVFNRGRGLGGIIGMAEQQKREWMKAKASAGDKEADRALRGRALDLQSSQYQSESEHRLALERSAEENRKAMLAEHQTDNERADKQLTLAEKREAELADYRKADLADREDARRDRSIARDEAASTRKEMAEARMAAAKEKSDQTFAEHYGTKTEKAQKAALALRQIDEVIAKYPNQDIPGLGLVGTDKGDWVRGLQRKKHEWTGDQAALDRDKDEQAVANAATELQQMLLRGETGAVAHPTEEQLDKVRTGFGAGRTQAQRLEALDIIRNSVYGDLRAHGAGNEAVSRRALELNHLDPDAIFGRAAVAAPPHAAAAPDIPEPGEKLTVIDDDEELKKLGMRRIGR